MNTKTNLYGLILTGGFSKRMGKEKALIDYHGLPQYQFLFHLLQAFCKPTFLSCRKEQQAQFGNEYPCIYDLYEGIGPMNGLLSFFKNHPASPCLLVACDMPFIGKKALRFLVKYRNPDKIATVFQSENKLPDPLLSIWEPASYPILKKHFQEDSYSLRELLQQSNIKRIHAQDSRWCLNVNDPKALELVRKELKLPPEKL